ncbi:MAG: 23S rRNA pseudouridine(1911/1915/1917) synthase RluD [Denitromonas halophila]|uniref:Pseudouridine synthase n=2 Tax=Denitromonas TaxID=139331 RepID=A0A558CNL3_9RHOO|nr:23S rRNA pseudouridine(1911/1915/1917) synthase RluD [Denitromonas ohlonensis]TVT50359.1 MAG: 23S rRNA pseudouridine(1911/1915/1917) synthase RluD [Denitromonas halophila]TVO69515.1 23S rRNA pseudouridine(1911/1915/1917) synthase RluD [Denitromonas ohlonensis]TVO77615.1 23S rRNA pseudouridine(1911/1915/1917) synthase RluD [Denitromonas ohlonensis]TVT75030.1 MAG: 23S rRNA pseudouridine(1911/1915/1917) synthase RluD [Denitromonas halophila]TVT78258.1 MAG: 23S rRNA pseudouridine(1911/1915/1917
MPLIVPDACAGMRIDQVLAQLLPEQSRNRLQTWVKEGRVLVDDRQVPPKFRVRGSENLVIDVPPPPEAVADAAEAIDLTVVFEDESLIVLNKPAGLVVHPGSGNWQGTMLNALLFHCPELSRVPRAGIVHRLDKDTSGLLVVAKTLPAQTDLVRQLQARTVRREYLALAHGQISTGGTVDAPIGRHPSQRTRMAVVGKGREAVTHYSVERRFDECTLVRCQLETGRTHQIRVHMTHVGHPLVGDPVYGKRRCLNAALQAFPRQALHAFQLGLIHPSSGESMAWTAPMPDDMQELIRIVADAAV